jgi:hypothetical protein
MTLAAGANGMYVVGRRLLVRLRPVPTHTHTHTKRWSPIGAPAANGARRVCVQG